MVNMNISIPKHNHSGGHHNHTSNNSNTSVNNNLSINTTNNNNINNNNTSNGITHENQFLEFEEKFFRSRSTSINQAPHQQLQQQQLAHHSSSSTSSNNNTNNNGNNSSSTNPILNQRSSPTRILSSYSLAKSSDDSSSISITNSLSFDDTHSILMSNNSSSFFDTNNNSNNISHNSIDDYSPLDIPKNDSKFFHKIKRMQRSISAKISKKSSQNSLREDFVTSPILDTSNNLRDVSANNGNNNSFFNKLKNPLSPIIPHLNQSMTSSPILPPSISTNPSYTNSNSGASNITSDAFMVSASAAINQSLNNNSRSQSFPSLVSPITNSDIADEYFNKQRNRSLTQQQLEEKINNVHMATNTVDQSGPFIKHYHKNSSNSSFSNANSHSHSNHRHSSTTTTATTNGVNGSGNTGAVALQWNQSELESLYSSTADNDMDYQYQMLDYRHHKHIPSHNSSNLNESSSVTTPITPSMPILYKQLYESQTVQSPGLTQASNFQPLVINTNVGGGANFTTSSPANIQPTHTHKSSMESSQFSNSLTHEQGWVLKDGLILLKTEEADSPEATDFITEDINNKPSSIPMNNTSNLSELIINSSIQQDNSIGNVSRTTSVKKSHVKKTNSLQLDESVLTTINNTTSPLVQELEKGDIVIEDLVNINSTSSVLPIDEGLTKEEKIADIIATDVLERLENAN